MTASISIRRPRRAALGAAALLTLGLAALGPRPARAQQGYQQTNLVTDSQANLIASGFAPAASVDPNLINPWGVSHSPTSPFWVSDQGTGVSTLYNTAGTPQALVVTVPPGRNAPKGPTGQVFNSTPDFLVTPTDKALFLFAGLDGTISGWNPAANPNNAILRVNNVASGAVYTGLALGGVGGNNFLYAANDAQGRIDVFDGSFAPATLAGNFTDPNLPAGLLPYNIQNVGGQLYVAYAPPRGSTTHTGVVDVFDASGNFVRRVASGGTLDSPWGVTLAPAGFGQFGGDLLVGNFGDGRINAFDPTSGAFRGQLTDPGGRPVGADGLWALTFGNGGNGGRADTLYFSAGIGGERHGLFGSIAPAAVPEPGICALLALGLLPVVAVGWRRRAALSRGAD